MKLLQCKSSSYFFDKNISTPETLCSRRLNPIALRKTKIVYNFGLSEDNKINKTDNFVKLRCCDNWVLNINDHQRKDLAVLLVLIHTHLLSENLYH